MKLPTRFIPWRVALAAALVAGPLQAQDGARHALEYAPAPADNPLKGLVPYPWPPGRQGRFPHSMEFNYFPLSDFVVGPGEYRWGTLDHLLDRWARQGYQGVFRVYVEFPGRTNAIPSFLVRQGLKVHRYLNTNTQPFPPAPVETPDYGDPGLREVLREFIAALGRRYDGDPRIGFITAGLLGTWGEWHTWPRDELFASKEVQVEVMDAYEAAFKTTPVLLRYPAGEGHECMAPNARQPFGYHDDSFAWATLPTGRKGDEWFFMDVLRRAGPAALDRWKTRPIGGEIRPEAWGKVFDPDPGDARIQDFRRCVEATHVTWLMDSGLFENEPSPQRRRNAEEGARRMGYEFHVPVATLGAPKDGFLPVVVEVENRGVAPFYYDWPVELGLIARGKVLRSFKAAGKLTGLLPGDPARVWRESLDARGLAPGGYRVALRVPNPMPKGRLLRFANKSQDADLPGWLTLGECRLP